MTPQQQATPAPIHDIVAPVAYFPYPIWMVVLAALAALAVLGALGWFLFFRKRTRTEPSVVDRTLAELRALRGRIGSAAPYEFSIVVSDVLRGFIRDARGLSATTQTSIEFLESIRNRGVFNDAERESLAAFLGKADLIKFARVSATADDCQQLVDSAEALVRGSAATPAREVAA